MGKYLASKIPQNQLNNYINLAKQERSDPDFGVCTEDVIESNKLNSFIDYWGYETGLEKYFEGNGDKPFAYTLYKIATSNSMN